MTEPGEPAAAVVRVATPEDEDALAELDLRAWGPYTSALPRPNGPQPFFRESTPPNDVLVAEASERVVGYITLGRVFPIESNAHVLQIHGLVVDPAMRRRGFARLLVDTAVDEARRRGIRKLSLRVFAPNEGARALYESAGFVTEGVLHEEFFLGGSYIDDVLMARRLD